jgi:hypothetical protein
VSQEGDRVLQLQCGLLPDYRWIANRKVSAFVATDSPPNARLVQHGVVESLRAGFKQPVTRMLPISTPAEVKDCAHELTRYAPFDSIVVFER